MTKNILKPEQIALVASKAGFKGDNLSIAVAVALAESGGNALAHGDTQLAPYGSYGLWQINSHAHPNLIGLPPNPSKWYDPYINATFAYRVSGGTNWRPWSVYIHDTYQTRMTVARTGVTLFLSNPSAVTPPSIVLPDDVVILKSTEGVVYTRLIKVVGPFMRGPDVKWVQQQLVKAGYSIGPDGVDSIYGYNTAAAVKEFQKKVFPSTSSEWDSIVGPKTWAKLDLVQ